MHHIIEAVQRHERIALQVSGGRDSIACLYLLQEKGVLPLVDVYWLNTGAAFPETIEIMAKVSELVRVTEIDGKQPQVIEQFGIPTDVLPRSCTPMGIATGQSSVKMQDTYSCCYRVVMEPMHRRMIDDGITLIIRGQKAADGHKSPLTSGSIENGIEYLFPIENWSANDVDAYLKKHNAPVHPAYEFMETTPDCMTCSGWWEDGRANYLQVKHPDVYKEYRRKLSVISAEARRHIDHFNIELGE